MHFNREISALVIFCCIVSVTWTSSDSVKLSEIKVLTLHQGLMTSGRRSSPVPQLKCTGGTAGCWSFIPKVVQCTNRGSDGTDVHWECKTDMDNAYRFGPISVSCEGYNYADDPYILKGSCGLEYTLDLTKEGYQQKNSDSKKSRSSYSNNSPVDFGKMEKCWLQWAFLWVILGIFIFLPLFGLVIYALYRLFSALYSLCTAPSTNDENSQLRNVRPRSNPPAPGFRPEFTKCDATCGGATAQIGNSGMGEAGFWARVANTLQPLGNQTIHYRRGTTSDYSPSPSNTTSSGTRTTSGFGETIRRGSDSPSSSKPTENPSTGTRTASGFFGTTRPFSRTRTTSAFGGTTRR